MNIIPDDEIEELMKDLPPPHMSREASILEIT